MPIPRGARDSDLEVNRVCLFVGRHEGVDGPLISQCSGATIDKGKREALLSDTQKPEPLS